MLFPLRQDFSDTQSSLALGSSITFDITREFHIDHMFLQVSVTPSAAMATANPDSLQAIVKRVVLTVADGARTRNVIDMSGPALLEYYQNINGQLDYVTNTNIQTNPSSGAKVLYYPIPFALPNLDDPVASMLLLPTPRFNANPQLRVDIASQADMDVNATPTFAVSALSMRLIILRRAVLLKSWPTYDCELLETQQAYASSGRFAYELQSPGSYTGILLRCYTSTTARGNVMTANGNFALELLGTQIRRFALLDNEMLNYLSKTPSAPATGLTAVFAGSYFMDFLSDKNGAQAGEMGSVLDANLPVTTGARLRLNQDITGGAGVQIKYVSHRIYGVLDNLKMLSRLGGKVKSV